MSFKTNAGQLAKALEQATREIRVEFKRHVAETANGLADDIREGYKTIPRRSGELRQRGVSVKFDETGLQASVRPKAPHAHLVEFGTAARKTSTGLPRGAVTGQSVHPVTIPAAHRRLPKFVADAERLLAKELTEVKGK